MTLSAIRTAQAPPAESGPPPGRLAAATSVDLASHRTEFRILGPLDVLQRGASVATGGNQRRALLARLLLEPNRTVPVDVLVDALWGEDVPSTAVKMVHIYVSQLRKVLPSDVLRTRPPGYALEVAPEAVDLLHFKRLRAEARTALAEGDAAAAADRLRAALALWRGPALAEFSQPFAVVEAAHIEELRLATVEDRIEAELALGQHGDVVGELRSLVLSHPLRQRLCGQLMLALYRAGRHAEALTVYREFRRGLQDELGIDPPAALSELEYQILNQDPALEIAPVEAPARERYSAARPARPLPAPAPECLVGREEELARLERALSAAAAGRGTAMLIAGPAGIGKTRLAAELAERARARGATVLTGRCIDLLGAALPYVPLIEALRPLRDSAKIDGLHELRRLVPATSEAPSAVPAERHAGESRLQLFEEITVLLGRLSATAPVVLVIEDLHWADGSTLDLLTFLAHAVRDRPIMLLASWRSDTVQAHDSATRLWTELRRAGLVEAIELGPLSDDELETLLARNSDSPVPAEVTQGVCARAQGNPFFAQELLAAALRGEQTLPRLLRDVLLTGFVRLDATSRSVLRAAAAVRRQASHALLSAALDLPDRVVIEALRQAVDHDLMVPDRASGTYRFRHALLAEAAYATLLPGEREEVHERLANALSEKPALAACRRTVAAEMSEHWIAAGRPVEALTASLRAAQEAEAVSGLSEALRHLERVLDLWEDVPHAEQVAGVALPAVLDWMTQLAGAARCCYDIDARSLAGVLRAAGDTADAPTVAAQIDVTTEAAAQTLDALARGGLLERAGDGVFRRARLAMSEARELYPLVLVLETIAVRQAPPFDEGAIAVLRSANQRLRAARHDPSAAILADDDFHMQLTARCGNEPLLDALRPLKKALLRYEQTYMLDPARIERSAAQHDGIVEALERQDHLEAAQRLRRNITGGLPDLRQALEG
ncbi:BTAD domain-containing putative transcriptional regulator [Capillimicrobium parvum]|uniref:OmpR/PhoB-type domain-containing protein n=1 Tax=Capillimicrobium parvum TaxID=2884022 RepID=A0A9E6XUV6_9ACTN|nr:BTAD domain-containing putative transcriptional regulator [Capillimicrobium parvum]UGS34922.1 hypothetical protein DSM104329_01304 [Capillimicrobium parvum]